MQIKAKAILVIEAKVSLYKNDVEEIFINSADGINKNGKTYDIYFENLEIGTKYEVKVFLSYEKDDKINEEVLCESVEISTDETDPRINVDIKNIKNGDGKFQFDFIIEDNGGYIQELTIYLTDKDGEILAYLSKDDGLSIYGNIDCYFDGLKENFEYKLIFVADELLYQDVSYRDLILKFFEFKTPVS